MLACFFIKNYCLASLARWLLDDRLLYIENCLNYTGFFSKGTACFFRKILQLNYLTDFFLTTIAKFAGVVCSTAIHDDCMYTLDTGTWAFAAQAGSPWLLVV